MAAALSECYGLRVIVFVNLVLLSSCSVLEGSGLGVIEEGEKHGHLFREILRDEAVQRIKELGKISDSDGYLERTFLSPAAVRAVELIVTWMQDAGLRTWVDEMGNVHGRSEAVDPAAGVLLIGSHLDTVVDAGMFDGSLGIISAISALKALKKNGKLQMLSRPVEVIAFSDEEGVRFQSTFLGSAAIAGTLPESIFQINDKSGATLQNVLERNLLEDTPEILDKVKYDPDSVWGYLEVHIEQGPVLEALDYPLGVVQGIAGQTRLKVTVTGTQGHAGTVPMFLRQDPMAASAELILTLETLCKQPEKLVMPNKAIGHLSEDSFYGLVCTVGELSTWPSASNVIPGQVNFTVDIRAMDDTGKEAVVSRFSEQVLDICDHRMVNCTVELKHTAKATPCDSELTLQLKRAALAGLEGVMPAGNASLGDVPVLMSGAGHDAMAMARLTKVGMMFVRSRGGISHSPEEYSSDDDIWAAGLGLVKFLEQNVVVQVQTCNENLGEEDMCKFI